MIIILNGLHYIMLLVDDSSVLLQARCHCTSGIGVCGRMWIQCMLLCISYSVRSCVVYVKYCNLAVDMAGVACTL